MDNFESPEIFEPPGIVEENGVWYLPSAFKHGYGPADAEAVFDWPYRGPETTSSKRTAEERALWMEGFAVERLDRIKVGYEYGQGGQKIVFHIDKARPQRKRRRSPRR